jgi:hypothetical protein
MESERRSLRRVSLDHGVQGTKLTGTASQDRYIPAGQTTTSLGRRDLRKHGLFQLQWPGPSDRTIPYKGETSGGKIFFTRQARVRPVGDPREGGNLSLGGAAYHGAAGFGLQMRDSTRFRARQF